MNADPNLKLIVAALLHREGGGIVITEEDIQAAARKRDRVTMDKNEEMDGWVIQLEDVEEA